MSLISIDLYDVTRDAIQAEATPNIETVVVGEAIIQELFLLAARLKGKVIQNVNSSAVGGGVAEILARMIPLLKQLGIDARWDVILITRHIKDSLLLFISLFHQGDVVYL